MVDCHGIPPQVSVKMHLLQVLANKVHQSRVGADNSVYKTMDLPLASGKNRCFFLVGNMRNSHSHSAHKLLEELVGSVRAENSFVLLDSAIDLRLKEFKDYRCEFYLNKIL